MVGKICFTIRPFNISRVSEDLHNKQQNKEVRRDTDQQKAVKLRLKSIKVDFFQTNNEITLTRVCVGVCFLLRTIESPFLVAGNCIARKRSQEGSIVDRTESSLKSRC